MGIATALALLGPAARPHVSLVVALWVPLGLVLATVVFLREAAGGAVTAGRLLDRLLRNPLVASVAAGLLLNAAGAGPLLREVPLLDTIGRAAVGWACSRLGAGLDLAALRSSGRALYAAILVGLLAKPALMAGVALAAGLDRTAAAVLVVFAAAPTSPSGYVMAAQMKADAPAHGRHHRVPDGALGAHHGGGRGGAGLMPCDRVPEPVLSHGRALPTPGRHRSKQALTAPHGRIGTS
jgi:predicted permease